MRSIGVVLTVIAMSLLSFSAALAGEVTISGAFLGTASALDQDDRLSGDSQRRGFDFAANVDINWELREDLRGIIQFQGAPEGGHLGFVDGLEIADLAIEYDADENIVLTAGSFDMPFGDQTNRLTNNGDATGSPFFLNTLLYSALAGTPVGTLNTLGIMGAFTNSAVDITAAVTNGTDEAADNPDGNIAGAFRATVMPEEFGGFSATGSLLYSDDSESSGSSGTRSEFFAILGELRFVDEDDLFAGGYLGLLNYGDDFDGTDDGVFVWMIEGGIMQGAVSVSGRISGWHPEDDDSDGSGISSHIPNSGFGMRVGRQSVYTDQTVMRFQGAVGYAFTDVVSAHAEGFFDNYDGTTVGRSTDVLGAVVYVSALF